MKSKITLIILLVIIFFLASLSIFLGYYYNKKATEVENLTAQIEILSNTQTTENEQIVTEIEKLAIAKYDSEKLDNSKKSDFTIFEPVAEYVTMSSDLVYRKGPKKEISSSAIQDSMYQLRYKTKVYTLSDTANIVDLKTQSTGVNSGAYFIVLLDDGTIQYAKTTATSLELEFKKYTDFTDVVALVKLGSTEHGKGANFIGAITSDGVTHILPYEMP